MISVSFQPRRVQGTGFGGLGICFGVRFSRDELAIGATGVLFCNRIPSRRESERTVMATVNLTGIRWSQQ